MQNLAITLHVCLEEAEDRNARGKALKQIVLSRYRVFLKKK